MFTYTTPDPLFSFELVGRGPTSTYHSPNISIACKLHSSESPFLKNFSSFLEIISYSESVT